MFDANDDPPALAQVKNAGEVFAYLVSHLELEQWSGWVQYLLEALETEVNTAGMEQVLSEVQKAIETRRLQGNWQAARYEKRMNE